MGMAQTFNRLMSKILTAVPALANMGIGTIKAYSGEGVAPNVECWTPFTTSLSKARVALVTTSGVHLREDKPFDMADPNGDHTYRVIPVSKLRSREGGDGKGSPLMITHDYYDHSDADKDINVVYPIDRLRELASEGVIGSIGDNSYSFMGHMKDEHIDGLVNETGPEVAKHLLDDGVDVVVLTPG